MIGFVAIVRLLLKQLLTRAALIPGICIGIGSIPAIFDGIRIGRLCDTSTNSVFCALLTIK